MNYAFQLAAADGHLNLVREYSQKYRLSPEALDTALYMAVSNNHFDVVKYLVEATTANPAANDNIALISALRKGYTQIVNYLIQLHTVQNVGLVPIIERYAGLLSIDEMQWLLRNFDTTPFFEDIELQDLSLEYNYPMMIPVLEDPRYRITDDELLKKYLLDLDSDNLIRVLKVPQIFRFSTLYPDFDPWTRKTVQYLDRYLPHWRDIPVIGRSLQTQSLKKILDLQL